VAAYEPGSLRDPDSAVFASGGHIRRGPLAQAAADWERLASTAFFGRLGESDQLVVTAVDEGDAPPSPLCEPLGARGRTRAGAGGPDHDPSIWSDYSSTCSYDDNGAGATRDFVRSVLAEVPTGQVLDLGANDGAYSVLAAEHADCVVAVDGDEKVVDLFYRRLRAEKRENVLPLVTNLADPPGGIGWRNREPAPFAEWVQPDVTLALALVHHLALGANLPLPGIVDWLGSFGGRLVVEFVHVDDPMVERLLTNKPAGLLDDHQRDAFERLLDERFLVHRQQTLPGGTCTMHLAEPEP
jgi:SAM-dependent methyltransferase